MKKLMSVLLAGIVLFANQCAEQNPLGKNGDAKNVKIAFATKTNAEIRSLGRSAGVYVSAPDMDSLYSPMSFSDSLLYGIIENVPVGVDRKFEVKVFDANGGVIYYGSAITDVVPGTTTYVTIKIHKVTDGNVVIIGEIVDEEIVTVSRPCKPWFVTPADTEWIHNDTDFIRCDTAITYPPIVFHTGCATSSDGLAVEYCFDLMFTLREWMRLRALTPCVEKVPFKRSC